jgi:hypothetical protein
MFEIDVIFGRIFKYLFSSGLSGLGIMDIDIEKKIEALNPNIQKQNIKVSSKHQIYDSSANHTENALSWNFHERESAGTIQAFHLSGTIYGH